MLDLVEPGLLFTRPAPAFRIARMVPRKIVVCLLVGLLALPIGTLVVLATARLLAAMADEAGAAGLERLALAGGLLWVLDMLGLLAVLAVNSLPPHEPPEE